MYNDDNYWEIMRNGGYNPAFRKRILAKRRAERNEKLALARQEAAERRDRMKKLVSASEPKRSKTIRSFHTYESIEARACRLFGVSVSDIKGTSRERFIVFVRHFIQYWTIRLTRLSLLEVGRLMSRDHTCVMDGKHRYPQKRANMGRFLPPIQHGARK